MPHLHVGLKSGFYEASAKVHNYSRHQSGIEGTNEYSLFCRECWQADLL